jgi:hypothetical protein
MENDALGQFERQMAELRRDFEEPPLIDDPPKLFFGLKHDLALDHISNPHLQTMPNLLHRSSTDSFDSFESLLDHSNDRAEDPFDHPQRLRANSMPLNYFNSFPAQQNASYYGNQMQVGETFERLRANSIQSQSSYISLFQTENEPHTPYFVTATNQIQPSYFIPGNTLNPHNTHSFIQPKDYNFIQHEPNLFRTQRRTSTLSYNKTSGSFDCMLDSCNHKFETLELLKIHHSNHPDITKKSFNCTKCSHSFSRSHGKFLTNSRFETT